MPTTYRCTHCSHPIAQNDLRVRGNDPYHADCLVAIEYVDDPTMKKLAALRHWTDYAMRMDPREIMKQKDLHAVIDQAYNGFFKFFCDV